MSPRVEFLKVRFTYLEKYEQWVLNDIDDFELEDSLVLGSKIILCRPSPDLGGLRDMGLLGYHADPLSPGKLPPDSVS